MRVKKIAYLFSFMLVILALVLSIAACGDPSNDDNEGSVTAINITPETLSLGEGESATIKARTTPLGENITWSVSQQGIVTLSEQSKTGVKVTAVSAGSVDVIAKNGNVSAKCTVTVSKIEISLDKKSLTIDVAEARKALITAEVTGTTSKPEWSSDNEEVAIVSANGVVTALKNGTANIKATLGTVEETCAVTVVAPQDYYLMVSGKNNEVVADPGVWYFNVSDDNSIANVDAYHLNGEAIMNITNLNAGVESYLRYQPDFITGTKFNFSLTLTIDKAAKVRFSGIVPSPFVTDLLQPGTYTVKNAAEEGDEAETTIYLGDTSVGTTPFAIRLLNEDNSSANGTFTVKVSDFELAAEFTLGVSSKKINLNGEELTAQITPYYYPEGATITYESSDESIATVDEEGLVTGVSVGTVTITATYTAGENTGTAAIDIDVYEGPSAEHKVTWSQDTFGITANLEGKYYQNGSKYDAISMVDGVITLTSNSERTFATNGNFQQLRIIPLDEEGNPIVKYYYYLTVTNNTNKALRYQGNINGLTASAWTTVGAGESADIVFVADATNGTDNKQFNFKLMDYGIGTVVISEIYIVPIS